MKKATLCLVMLMILSTPVIAYYNEPKGYDGWEWGIKIEDVEYALKTSDNLDETSKAITSRSSKTKEYYKPSEYEDHYKMEPQSLSFIFTSGNLASVIIRASGENETKNLIQAAMEKHGIPDNVQGFVYSWNGKTTSIRLVRYIDAVNHMENAVLEIYDATNESISKALTIESIMEKEYGYWVKERIVENYDRFSGITTRGMPIRESLELGDPIINAMLSYNDLNKSLWLQLYIKHVTRVDVDKVIFVVNGKDRYQLPQYKSTDDNYEYDIEAWAEINYTTLYNDITKVNYYFTEVSEFITKLVELPLGTLIEYRIMDDYSDDIDQVLTLEEHVGINVIVQEYKEMKEKEIRRIEK